MRVPIPVVGPAWENRERKLAKQVTRNLWPEINPDARAEIALHHRPGLKNFATLTGKDRGMHEYNNFMYAVSGSRLHRIDENGVNEDLGEVLGDDRCVFANDGLKLIITNGLRGHIYTESGGLEVITDPDLINPTSVAYLNAQFLFDQNNGTRGEFVVSDVGLDTTFNVSALEFANAEAHPDDIVRVFSFQQLVYFFGERTLEVWYNSGEGTPPFKRAASGVKPYGLAGTHAVTSTAEFIYFLDEKRRPRRMLGHDIQNIGNPALGAEFAEYSRINDCIVFSYVQDHQTFVVFTFPTMDKTWVYHEPSNSWWEWTYGVNGARSRASSALQIYGLNYVADHTNGKIYELDPCTYTDDGQEIQRIRDTVPIHGGLYNAHGRPIYFDTVEFVIARDPCVTAGLGRIEIDVIPGAGVCATVLDVTRDEILSPVNLMVNDTAFVQQGSVDTDSIAMADTKQVCFTAAFNREAGQEPSAADTFRTIATRAPLMAIYQSNTQNSSTGDNFSVWMDSSGFIRVTARDDGGTTLLDATITNSGATFCDSTTYLIGFVADLADETKREVWVNGTDVTDTNVTWNNYVNGTIKLTSSATDEIWYEVGGSTVIGSTWSEGANRATNPGDPWYNGLTSCGFFSFDNACTLVPAAMWDDNGYVMDPQGDWTGWYTTQPKIAFSSSWFKHAGSLGQLMERDGGNWLSTPFNTFFNDYIVHPGSQAEAARVNDGLAGTISGEYDSDGTVLPPPASETRIEIVSPYYDLPNFTNGNWVSLNSIPKAGLSGAIGGEPDGPATATIIPTNVAYSFNVSRATKAAIRYSTYASLAALIVVDEDGDVIDKARFTESSGIAEVDLPSGGNYYLVVASDTGEVDLRTWVPVEPSTFLGEVYSFDEFFGLGQVHTGTYAHRNRDRLHQSAYGIAIRFYLKSGRKINWEHIPTAEGDANILQSSISTTAGDFNESTALAYRSSFGTIKTTGLASGWYYANFRILNYAQSLDKKSSINSIEYDA